MNMYSTALNQISTENDAGAFDNHPSDNHVNDTKFYKAILKGGHVSRKYYIEFYSYICAPTKKDAAKKCREVPRAKRNHKDFILDLNEISYSEYSEGINSNNHDPYLHCKNKQEQDKILPLISDRIKPDPHFEEGKNNRKKNPAGKKRYTNRYVDLRNDWIKELENREPIA